MNKTVLITGATSGIGLEFAKIFAKEKYDLILVARTEEKLKSLCDEFQNEFGIKADYVVKDLSFQNSAQELYEEVKNKGITIDILVNNAGYTVYGKFADLGYEKDLGLINTNIYSLVAITKLFLPNMVANKYGKILNLASTAAFLPGPLMTSYYASKAFVLSFSLGLSNELKDTGVSITALCPGPTKTGFQDRGNIKDIKLMQTGLMDSKKVAEIGFIALMQNKPIAVAGVQNNLMTIFSRFLPKTLLANVVRKAQER